MNMTILSRLYTDLPHNMDWMYDRKNILIGGAVIGLGYLFLWRRKTKLPPGPTPLPLLGNVLTFMWTSDTSYEVLTKWSKKYGDVYTFYLGTSAAIVLNSIDSIREALVTKQNDFAGRPEFFTINLSTENGKDIAFGQFTPTWQLHRKLVHAAIRNYASGKTLEDRVHECLGRTIAKMNSETKPFYPKLHIDFLVYNIICGMAFGKVYESDDPEFIYISGFSDETMVAFGSGLLEDYIPFIQHIYTTQGTKNVKRIVKKYLDFLTDKWEQHQVNYDPDHLRDLTDYLINTQRSMQETEEKEVLAGVTDRHMIQTISDFFSAGTDTTRFTLMWIIAFLAANPNIQKKMQQYIDDVCGSRPVTLADRTKLPYVDAVLFESMRLGTVAPNAVPHKTTCDTSVGGYNIPKDTMVLVNIHALHFNEDFWEEPSKFKPERFLDSDGSLAPKPSHFMPFSAGRRVCVGEILAKHELFLLIASLYQQLDIVSPPGEPVKAELSDYNMACIVKDYKVVVNQRE